MPLLRCWTVWYARKYNPVSFCLSIARLEPQTILNYYRNVLRVSVFSMMMVGLVGTHKSIKHPIPVYFIFAHICPYCQCHISTSKELTTVISEEVTHLSYLEFLLRLRMRRCSMTMRRINSRRQTCYKKTTLLVWISWDMCDILMLQFRHTCNLWNHAKAQWAHPSISCWSKEEECRLHSRCFGQFCKSAQRTRAFKWHSLALWVWSRSSLCINSWGTWCVIKQI